MKCSRDDCERTVKARGLCGRHYEAARRRGEFRREPPSCGTYAGYQWHVRHDEPKDEACRQARNDYMTAFRAARPEYRERSAVRNAANHRALWKLARRYPGVFRELVVQELRR